MVSLTVGELVAACRAGRAEAWDEVLNRYEHLVFTIARREGLSVEDAADATQTTFESLFAQLDRIQNREQIVSWLMTVARRQAWRIRNEGRRQYPDEEAVSMREHAADPTDELGTIAWLHEGVTKLPSPCRELIIALYFDPASPSYADIAAKLGRPVGSIGPTRARCLQHLREILGDWP